MNRFKAEASFETDNTDVYDFLCNSTEKALSHCWCDCFISGTVHERTLSDVYLQALLRLHRQDIRFHISQLTYAYLIIRLGVSDALEFKLVERVGELPLGRWQTWENRGERKRGC